MLGGASSESVDLPDPWIHCQQMPSQQTDECKMATFASWNANALLPHVQQIAAMDFQITALQEIEYLPNLLILHVKLSLSWVLT